MRTRQEVRVYRINKECDHCKTGNLISTGKSFTTNVTSFEHKCSNPECKEFTILVNEVYPKLVHEPNGEIEIILD